MPSFRRTDDPRPVIEELEAFAKRARWLPVAIPALLVLGGFLGRATTHGISLRDGRPVRIAAAQYTPRAQLENLSVYMRGLRNDGRDTEDYVVLYRNHVRPVEASLESWGVDADIARRVAWPLVEHSYARGLDPATVVAVVLVESSGRPTATSFVGARGLMQVMPIHQGRWGCGSDLYDIDANLCYGTQILAANLARFRGDERRALLAYNGCVNGTNTPDCHTYPDKIRRLRSRVRAEWRELEPATYESVRLGARPTPSAPEAPASGL